MGQPWIIDLLSGFHLKRLLSATTLITEVQMTQISLSAPLKIHFRKKKVFFLRLKITGPFLSLSPRLARFKQIKKYSFSDSFSIKRIDFRPRLASDFQPA